MFYLKIGFLCLFRNKNRFPDWKVAERSSASEMKLGRGSSPTQASHAPSCPPSDVCCCFQAGEGLTSTRLIKLSETLKYLGLLCFVGCYHGNRSSALDPLFKGSGHTVVQAQLGWFGCSVGPAEVPRSPLKGGNTETRATPD